MSYSGYIAQLEDFADSEVQIFGDGVGDDTDIFERALQSGYPIIEVPRPSEFFKITRTLNIPEDLDIALVGGDGCRINLVSNTPMNLFNVNGSLDLQSFYLERNTTEQSNGSLIKKNDIGSLVINNVSLCNSGSKDAAIRLYGDCSQSSIEDVSVFGNGYTDQEWKTVHGIQLRYAKNVKINGFYCEDLSGFGIHGMPQLDGEGNILSASNAITISNAVTKSNRLELIGLQRGCDGVMISNCKASGTGDNGISVSGSGFMIYNCVTHNNDHSGIGIYGSNGIVKDCISFDNNQAGTATLSDYFVAEWLDQGKPHDVIFSDCTGNIVRKQ